MRTYHRDQCSVFKKTNEQWGEFSNMSAFPITVSGIDIRTTEALYQALRYPDHPDLQEVILDQKSPMAAKMKSKPHRKDLTHPDFEEHKLWIMEWCVRVKIAQHYETIVPVMQKAGTIVEKSRNDKFWGAVPQKEDPNILIGENHLGEIWNKLKIELARSPESLKEVPSLGIESMKLSGSKID